MTRSVRELGNALDAILLGPKSHASAGSIMVEATSAGPPAVAPARNIVPLFSGQDVSTSASGADAPVLGSVIGPEAADAVDWPGAIQLVQDVGARVRRARDLAQELTRESQSLIQRTLAQAESAEERARAAEALAQQAELRAEKAEAAARSANERARSAGEQMQVAMAAEAEARLWLGRLYASLKSEFDSLTDD
ncbi:hypothetical protein [Methylobacterium planeticum]|uniref:Uncharacterized protein n=1 Tax=Methylobacterium planeticum TaxID=2615211 RepID=A0A6N6MKF6_9HYPH|nr:hypothetical protein [Methylobacterium planeticum]KAB1070117.1 hypothetical protein F6X51_23870 [Methylobacterium planeticum]